MKRPTVLELEAHLRDTAISLLSAARCMADETWRAGRPSADGGCNYHCTLPEGPTAFSFAANAFEALELLGYNLSDYSSVRELRPWAGAL